MESLVTLTIWLVACCGITVGKTCLKYTNCECRFDDGSGTVDLSTLGLKGEPLVKDVQGEMNAKYLYSFNPCYAFDEGTCKNASGCQFDTGQNVHYQIGDADNVDFKYDGSNVVAFYSTTDSLGVKRFTYVTYVCDRTFTTPKVQVIGEIAEASYTFTVTSSAVCPKGSSNTSPKTTPASGRVTSRGGSGIYININNNVNVLSKTFTNNLQNTLMGLTVLVVGILLLFGFGKRLCFRNKQVIMV